MASNLAAAASNSGGSSLRSLLPANLEKEATNVIVLSEVIDKLDSFQNQSRAQLFRTLLHAAQQPSPAPLEKCLSALSAHSEKLIADSPEAGLAPHVPTYHHVVRQLDSLTSQISRLHATADLEQQVAELGKHLEKGRYTDAAWCCVQLQKLVTDAEDALSSRQQAAEAEGNAEAEADASGSSASAAAAAASTAAVTEESVQLLREAQEGCASRVRQLLEACCRDAVVITAGSAAGGSSSSGSVAVSGTELGPGGVASLSEVLSAAEVLGMRDDLYRSLSDALVSGVLVPLLSGPRVAKLDGTRLTWQAGEGEAPSHRVQTLLRLLAQHLFAFDEDLIKAFGEVFWRAVVDEYTALVAGPTISAHAEDVELCGEVVAGAQDLEAYAESLSFIDGSEYSLGPAVEALARHAMASRQEHFLERARTMLLAPPGTSSSGQQQQQQGASGSGGAGSSLSWEVLVAGAPVQLDQDYYNRLLSGAGAAGAGAGTGLKDWEADDPPCGVNPDGPVLAQGQYQVTRRIDQVVRLVQEMFAEAHAGSRAVSRALHSAICSVCLLARTLPAAAAPQALEAPQLACLTHNDLAHLAGQLLLLAHAYCNPALLAHHHADEPTEAAQQAAAAAAASAALQPFLEEAVLLRDAARTAMRSHLAVQQAALDELMASGYDGFRGLVASGMGLGGGGGAGAKAGLAARRTSQQLLHSLGKLGRAACEVLAPEDCVAAAATLLNHVAVRVVAEVMAKSDIGTDESAELVAALSPLADGAVEAWLSSVAKQQQQAQQAAGGAGAATLSGVPIDVVNAAITSRARQLRRLRGVLRVLRATSVQEVADAWGAGELSGPLALSAQDLEQLLLATAADSPSRRTLLTQLRGSA